MLGRPISLATCCALGASAFLLPPPLASTEDDTSAQSLNLLGGLRTEIVQLPCSSCAWPVKDQVTELDEAADDVFEVDLFWVQGGANNLILNFTISEDGQALLVNDHYIYPFEKLVENKNMMEDMYIEQVPASVSTKQVYKNDYSATRLQVTGSGLSENEVVTGETDDESVITLTWQLMSLEHQPMTVDPVLIQLVRTATGELLILSVEAETGTKHDDFAFLDDLLTAPPAPPSSDEPETKPHGRPCNMPRPFCALTDFVSSVFGSSHRKPCPGKFDGKHLPTHIRPQFGRPPFGADDFELADAEPEHQHFGPPSLNKVDFRKPWHRLPDPMSFDHPPHHGGHRHGHHRHGFFHAISRGILAVLIPIMAGITVGIVVSVTGLLFGRFLGWLWFTVLRRGRRGYSSVALEEEHVSYEKEDVTAEEEEALPLYESAPRYENRESTTT